MFSGVEYLLKTTRLWDADSTESLKNCVSHGLVRLPHLDRDQGSTVLVPCAEDDHAVSDLFHADLSCQDDVTSVECLLL